MQMDIQIIVPWGKDKNLGATYNRLMEDVHDWVCFLDHDILNVNPNWYKMCVKAAETIGHQAGWITGVTNRIACPMQRCEDAPQDDNIMAHMHYAKQRYAKYQANAHIVDPSVMLLEFSGFMILTHKKAWEKVGGFDDGFLGVDNWYHQKLLKADYKTYVLQGLYMYHIYNGKQFWDKF